MRHCPPQTPEPMQCSSTCSKNHNAISLFVAHAPDVLHSSTLLTLPPQPSHIAQRCQWHRRCPHPRRCCPQLRTLHIHINILCLPPSLSSERSPILHIIQIDLCRLICLSFLGLLSFPADDEEEGYEDYYEEAVGC